MSWEDGSELVNNMTHSGAKLPTAEIVDYAEIAMLTCLVLVGVPLNLASFVRSLKTSSLSSPSQDANRMGVSSRNIRQQIKMARKTMLRASALEFHLTVANLLVICLYGFSQICWLSTYSWKGGDLLCRLVKFCDTFCFYATSNIVVCISIDRVYVSARVDRPLGHGYRRDRFYNTSTFSTELAVAWILAFVCSIPQLVVWQVFTPYASEFPNWHQCITIWMVRTFGGQVDDGSESALFDRQMEKAYTSLHLLLVFWVPLLIILCSYVLIVIRFHEKISLNVRDTRLQQRAINALLFKKRATSFHKRSRQARPPTREPSGETTALNRDATTEGQSSAGRLAAVPIVINCSQAFLCQPILANTAVKTLSRAQRRTIKTAFWILLAYIVCWSPYNALVLWRYIDQSFESRFLEFSANFIVLNAVLNPIIYKIR